MYHTITDSSPLSSRGSNSSSILKSLYLPERSSSPLRPLNALSNQDQLTSLGALGLGRPSFSGHKQDQSQRRKQYKSRNSSRIEYGGGGGGGDNRRFDDSPAGQLLRDQFKAHCLQRARQEKRAGAVKTARKRSFGSDNLFSSDGFDYSDAEMDVDMDDENENAVFEDELYKRVMLNEIRRSKHALNVSFEREFGSSIDPNMYEDMNALEEGFTGKWPAADTNDEESPLSDIEYDDALIAEYLAEMEESELEAMKERVACGMVDINTEDPYDLERQFAPQINMTQQSPSRSVYSSLTLSSCPTSPAFQTHASLFMMDDTHIDEPGAHSYSCPFCHSQTRLYDQIACSNCIIARSLQHAQTVWADPEMHASSPPFVDSDRLHIPLIAMTPAESGVGDMMLCSCERCDWCLAL